MPRNTISVGIVDNNINFSKSNYFSPLFIFKESNLKKEESIVLTALDYDKKIDAIEKNNGQNIDDAKTVLKEAFGAFFSEDALKFAKLFHYKTISAVKTYLEKNLHPFIIFIPSKDKEAKDCKDDYNTLKGAYPSSFFVLPINSVENSGFVDPFNTKPKGTILIYNKDECENLYLKFIAQYLYQASSFVATNPYGIQVKSKPLTDSTLIEKLRNENKNINFYSRLNEDGRDDITAYKEGVDLQGNPLDRLFTEYYIKTEAIRELISIWSRNHRLGSKLSGFFVGDDRPNIYTATLEGFFKELLDRRLIVYYSDIKVKVTNVPELRAYVTVKYNDSVNEVVLEIISEDLNTYLRREANAL